MGAAESQLVKKELSPDEELALFAYVVDNCLIKPPVPPNLQTYNDTGCKASIPAIIKTHGKSSGLDMVVYRGQYDKKEISYDISKPFFSVTTDPEYAHTFASKLYEEDGEEIKWGIDCCVFKIHLQNVQILDLKEISFDRVRKEPPALAPDALEKFNAFIKDESEILVLGGGSFYTSPACTEKGCIDPPAFDVPDEEFHQFHETWYSMPKRVKRKTDDANSNPPKRAMGVGGSTDFKSTAGSRVSAHVATNHGAIAAMHHHETRRAFKKPRLMSRKYCKKTPCRRMGFTQKASCRPYKNCYTRRR
jgi:hypothetical protein